MNRHNDTTNAKSNLRALVPLSNTAAVDNGPVSRHALSGLLVDFIVRAQGGRELFLSPIQST
jgi:hypothetical protein